MNDEKLSSKQHEQGVSQPELAREAELASERIREQHEQAENRSPEKTSADKEQARHEALEHAKKAEVSPDKSAETQKTSPEKRARGKRSKRELDNSYKEIMQDTRAQMPVASRTFSKVIHNRAVETASDAVGGTIARPNAILTGSFSAFIVTLVVYLVARHYGYPLSGSESLIAFAAGWLLGVLFDFFRIMITGKR